jgi:hypothetical protein
LRPGPATLPIYGDNQALAVLRFDPRREAQRAIAIFAGAASRLHVNRSPASLL